jgi:hypothetical protein
MGRHQREPDPKLWVIGVIVLLLAGVALWAVRGVYVDCVAGRITGPWC